MKLIKYDSLASTLSELIDQRQATEQATDQTLAALADALATTDVDGDYISYTVGSEPDSSGATSGTIGAYFKEEGLFQKVEWDGNEWQEIGEPVVARKYVDDKTSLSGSQINVLDFGAKADGETADSYAMNSAITAIISAGGGVVVVPTGIYLVRSIVVKSNVTLKGMEGTKFIIPDNADLHSINLGVSLNGNDAIIRPIIYTDESGSENIIIEGIEVDANGGGQVIPGTGDHLGGICLYESRNSTVRNCHVYDVGGTDSSGQPDGLGISVLRSTDCRIYGNLIERSGYENIAIRINSHRIIISNNHLLDGGR